jgi:hypothetical protein
MRSDTAFEHRAYCSSNVRETLVKNGIARNVKPTMKIRKMVRRTAMTLSMAGVYRPGRSGAGVFPGF